MRKEKGERAGALMSRMVISPFSFLLSPFFYEKTLPPPFPPRPFRSSAGEV